MLLYYVIIGVFNVQFVYDYVIIRFNAGSVDGKPIRNIERSDGFR